MPIPLPITKTKIDTTVWGIPVTNALNTLTDTSVPGLNSRLTALENKIAGITNMFRGTTTGQNLPVGVYEPVILTAENVDSGNWHSTSTNPNRVTPNIPGWYVAIFHAEVTGLAITDRVATAIDVNGVASVRDDRQAGISNPDLSISTAVLLNGTTDYISSSVYHSSATAKTLNVASLAVFLVRPT